MRRFGGSTALKRRGCGRDGIESTRGDIATAWTRRSFRGLAIWIPFHSTLRAVHYASTTRGRATRFCGSIAPTRVSLGRAEGGRRSGRSANGRIFEVGAHRLRGERRGQLKSASACALLVILINPHAFVLQNDLPCFDRARVRAGASRAEDGRFGVVRALVQTTVGAAGVRTGAFSRPARTVGQRKSALLCALLVECRRTANAARAPSFWWDKLVDA